MALATQTRYPRLWTWFQYGVGGVIDKRKLVLRHYSGQDRILEVGCSTGTLATAFLAFPGVRYTGVDIDPAVIRHARRAFRRHPRFRFVCADLQKTGLGDERFDYVLLAGVCHHVEDEQCRALLDATRRLLDVTGTVVVSEPLVPRADDPWLVRQFIRFERGGFVRPGPRLVRLLTSVPDLSLAEAEEHLVTATPAGWPIVARFGLYRLCPTASPAR